MAGQVRRRQSHGAGLEHQRAEHGRTILFEQQSLVDRGLWVLNAHGSQVVLRIVHGQPLCSHQRPSGPGIGTEAAQRAVAGGARSGEQPSRPGLSDGALDDAAPDEGAGVTLAGELPLEPAVAGNRVLDDVVRGEDASLAAERRRQDQVGQPDEGSIAVQKCCFDLGGTDRPAVRQGLDVDHNNSSARCKTSTDHPTIDSADSHTRGLLRTGELCVAEVTGCNRGYPRAVSEKSGIQPSGEAVTGRWDGVDVNFGEEGGRLTYGSYLRLANLLDQQRLESDPPAHDELLFITIHQVYELWFKQVLHEMTASRDAMLSGQLWLAQHLLRRVHTIERTLTQQVDILETMTPQDFGEFRHRLSPASGFQSVQFREIEFLSGAKDPSFVKRFRGLSDAEKARLERRLAEPTLWDAFLVVLEQAGFSTADEDDLRKALQTVASDRGSYAEIWEMAEALVQHDELAAAWRARHVVMVERMIGTKPGTGGSSGAGYLRSRLDLRYYPLLWDLRSSL